MTMATNLVSATKSPQVNTLQSDKNGGTMAIGCDPFDDKDLQESSDTGKPSRLRATNKTVNEEEVVGKALQAKQ